MEEQSMKQDQADSLLPLINAEYEHFRHHMGDHPSTEMEVLDE
jgi:hypothetical protein